MKRFSPILLTLVVTLAVSASASAQSPNNLLRRVRQADTNGDGALQPSEFEAFLSELPRLRLPEERRERWFQRLDTDQNQALDRNELRSLGRLLGSAADPNSESVSAQTPTGNRGPADALNRLRQLRGADTNRDGKLSFEEFAQLADRREGLRDQEDRQRALFDRADADQDQQLSREELTQLVQALASGMPQRMRNNQRRENPFPEFLKSVRRLQQQADAGKPLEIPEATPESLAFFEEKIQPLLEAQCYRCHSGSTSPLRGGLRVDTPHGLLIGGESGAAVVPGRPEESPLYLALLGDDYPEMPPEEPLSEEAIEQVRRWIELGAPDSRHDDFPVEAETPAAWEAESAGDHWAFHPPQRHRPPNIESEPLLTDVDRFIRAGLTAAGLEPVGQADRSTLLRRVCFDLTGLPPSPEMLQAFVADPAPTLEALEGIVDTLLASPQFGERWGRHWLDVARYAESSGKEFDVLYPHAWRYRDYVIDAWNEDKPYDRFLQEQLAGDLLPASSRDERARLQIATGYLAIGSKSVRETDLRKLVLEIADEQIDAVTRGVMGISVACARCHDHKFEPISQRDYYALAGIFSSTETLYGGIRSAQVRSTTELIEIPADLDPEDPAPLDPAYLDAVREQLSDAQQQLRQLGRDRDAQPQRRRLTLQIQQLSGLLDQYDDQGNSTRVAMGVRDWQACDLPLLMRGELERPGEIVPRGFVSVLTEPNAPTIHEGSGRLELARWITQPEHPLTARVLVNRVWQHLFGRGIVATPDDFGHTGASPTHPELLDTLAVEFVEDGWSLKRLIRKLVLTQTYVSASTPDTTNLALDPDNQWFWRQTPRRLEAEAIRDAMLMASGNLQLERPIGSLVARLGDGNTQQVDTLRDLLQGADDLDRAQRFAEMGQRVGRRPTSPQALIRTRGLNADPFRELHHRSVYLPVVRTTADPTLAPFDVPDASLVTGQRDTTIVAPQSLYLLNSNFVLQQADAMAERLLDEAATDEQRIELAFLWTLNRAPRTAERAAALEFLETFPQPRPRPLRLRNAGLDSTVWSAFCQGLFATAEFQQLN